MPFRIRKSKNRVAPTFDANIAADFNSQLRIKNEYIETVEVKYMMMKAEADMLASVVREKEAMIENLQRRLEEKTRVNVRLQRENASAAEQIKVVEKKVEEIFSPVGSVSIETQTEDVAFPEIEAHLVKLRALHIGSRPVVTLDRAYNAVYELWDENKERERCVRRLRNTLESVETKLFGRTGRMVNPVIDGRGVIVEAGGFCCVGFKQVHCSQLSEALKIIRDAR